MAFGSSGKKATVTLHMGFNRWGSVIRSETPIDNQATNFLRWLSRETLSKLLSPSDVVREIAAGAPELQRLFSLGVLGSWSPLDRFWHWPATQASRPSEQFIRCMGEPRPIWLADENRWEKLCEDAERMYRTECRFEHVAQIETGMPVPPMLLTCRVHGDVPTT